MWIVSDKLPLAESSAKDLVECRDITGGLPLVVRVATSERSTGTLSIPRQYLLHRLLSKSGVVDAKSLILKNGQVTGFTMPRLLGDSLWKSASALSSREIVTVLRDAAFAVFSLHTLEHVHGDLSPNNILVSKENANISGILVDLEFASTFGTTSETEIRGTRGYIAPETSRGLPSAPSFDAFAFGRIIEWSLAYIDDGYTRRRLEPLVTACTHPDPMSRLTDFSVIYHAMMQVLRDCCDSRCPHTAHLVPLRQPGLDSRYKSWRLRLNPLEKGQLMLCAGEEGAGKSESMRYFGYQLQIAGAEVVHFGGVQGVEELTEALQEVLSLGTARPGGLFLVETNYCFQLGQTEFRSIQKLAALHRVTVVIEFRQIDAVRAYPSDSILVARPLTHRECIHATSHLITSSTIQPYNAEALMAITHGNPGAVRSVMSEYFTSGRRSRGEPVDLGRHCRLIDDRPGKVRTHSNPIAERIMDQRQTISKFLQKYFRRENGKQYRDLASFQAISDGFGRLGSPRRQARWAKRGIAWLEHNGLDLANTEQALAYFALMGSACAPKLRIEMLERISKSQEALPSRVRMTAKSNLGAAYLFSREIDMAANTLREAMALAKQAEEHGDMRASILNRLGTAKLLAHDYGPARKYLTEAALTARTGGNVETISRIEGNLGLLALYQGDPRLSLKHFRRHRQHAQRSKNYAEHLTTLVNETNSYVDLGLPLAAERRARLAATLAEMLSDEMRLAYSHSNLTWILGMRCHGRAALEHLRRSQSIRSRIGDSNGVADNKLHLSRLSLYARDYAKARNYLDEAQRTFDLSGNREGIWDCLRLQGKIGLAMRDHDLAHASLSALPLDAEGFPEKDRVEIRLLWLELHLWSGDKSATNAVLTLIDSSEALSRVHWLTERRRLLGGHLALLETDFETAHAMSTSAAEQFRRSGREDLLLDTIPVIALLAGKMGNPSAGLRYLRYSEEVSNRLRKELSG